MWIISQISLLLIKIHIKNYPFDIGKFSKYRCIFFIRHIGKTNQEYTVITIDNKDSINT